MLFYFFFYFFLFFFFFFFFFFFNDTATTEIYTRKDTLSLHDALPISPYWRNPANCSRARCCRPSHSKLRQGRSEEHTSELQSPFLSSYAVFCLKKKSCICSYQLMHLVALHHTLALQGFIDERSHFFF